jgi:hypothetical protein
LVRVSIAHVPDLVVSACPLGCDEKCPMIWYNESIDHYIVCKCNCRHTKGMLEVSQPVADTTHHIIPKEDIYNKDDS